MNINQENFVYNPQPLETPNEPKKNEEVTQQEQNTILSSMNPNLTNMSQQTNNINDLNYNNQIINQSTQNQNVTNGINDNQLINPQSNIDMINNNTMTLNVIPNSSNQTNNFINNNDNIYNGINSFSNINNINNIGVNQDNNRKQFNGVFSNQKISIRDNMSNEDYEMLNPQPDNKFINTNIDTNSTNLTDLNNDQNAMKIDYSNDPKVRANIDKIEENKNTITITSETKVFLVIIVVLLLFIFIMPYIFDIIKNIG